ncbi:hypothetical protein CWR48_07240 [Oceanobacillus arenosus]|uniref:Swarming motility protein SwrB n=1 Tax=Oceanobacillus arenosus TaxID=1229153 RepID=A0A3D8PVC8_9BACI|nr:hypothetical protein [Oceanobacillus arenosus]RDW19507.1 hypothetical protein CWR48_07240 [Oceanobacillus arenosus]
MQSLLLIISFLLHIAALYAIYRLYQQVQSFKKEDTTEVMELFETYLLEIKEENNRLQEELNSSSSSNNTSWKSHAVSEDKMNHDPVPQKEVSQEPQDTIDTPIIDEKVHDVMETSLEAKILQLHHQGMSIMEIAQQLNRGKTEVELFIKMYKKNKGNA